MSDIMQQLHIDHVNMAKLLDVLELQLERMRCSEEVDYGLLIDIMLYVTQYPDLYHHPKEDLVFERVLLYDKNWYQPIRELIVDHRSIAQEGLRFLDSLRGVENDAVVQRAELIEQGERYIHHLRQHMDKEEGELFPKALEILQPNDWEIIDARLGPRPDPLFGDFVAEQFNKRYAQLMSLIDAPPRRPQ